MIEPENKTNFNLKGGQNNQCSIPQARAGAQPEVSNHSADGNQKSNTISSQTSRKEHNSNLISNSCTEQTSCVTKHDDEICICDKGNKIENYNEARERWQMRSSHVRESPLQLVPPATRTSESEQLERLIPMPMHKPDGRIEVESCRLLLDSSSNNNLGKRLSVDKPNCENNKFSNRSSVGGGVGSSEVEHKELEVEWRVASLFKRASRFSSDSRSLCVKTGFVRGDETLPRKTLGGTIKSFVTNFRFNLNDATKLDSKSSELRCRSTSNSSSSSSSNNSCKNSEYHCHVNDSNCLRSENEFEPSSISLEQKQKPSCNSATVSQDNDHIRTSYSCQSILNSSAIIEKKKDVKQEFETTRSGEELEEEVAQHKSTTVTATLKYSYQLTMNKSTSNFITKSPPIMANSAVSSVGSLAKNKYVIEDKLKRQKQQQQQPKAGTGLARMEYRRSTHCSSIGAMTSDMNYDSSLSSVNNCSESNNTCTTTNRQWSGDHIDRTGSGDGDDSNSNICKHPSDSNQCNILVINEKRKSQRQGAKGLKKRENWDKNIEFLLAVIGFAVDLGNVWRFPYICYKNGGGAFLIPYTVMFILGGLPIFYLEMSLGQYFSSGCLTVWKRVCPMAKGIGYAMCVLNFFTGLYYNTIISWAVFFFVESFTDVLPWTSCNNSWNSGDCKTIDQRQNLKSNVSSVAPIYQIEVNQTQQVHFSSPTKDYFEREVLQVHLSSGIDDLGYVRKPLAIYLAIVFICIYFAIWKGVKSTGKAVWITALLPYFVLIPLLIRGVFLEGAWLGIKYYLSPQWVMIVDVNVWVEAAKQIYFSLGPGFGTLMALSSYNKFNHNCRRDALIAASVNYFASFISGLVIFAVLGYMATIENVNINDVATEGPGLVFQVYPEGLATMRFSSMWSVLFFIMVITLGIDSTFGGLESVITGLCDEYPRVLRAHRGIFIGFLIILIYLCSLPTTTYGGNYVIYVLESYGTSLSLLFIVLVETIIVCWLYGADRFCKNLEEMYGETPGAYWHICWKYISPTILLIIFVAACGQELDKYHTLTNGDYTYPGWAPTIGLLMTGSSVCCIPIYAIYYLKTKTSGSFIERLKIASRPIEGDQKGEKEIYVDALTDKIREDGGDVHLDTVI